FLAYGLPAGAGEPTAAVERIRKRPAAVQEAIIFALNVWVNIVESEDSAILEAHSRWLRAVLEATDLTPWCQQVYKASAVKDPAGRRAALEKLAASDASEKVPASALHIVAGWLRPEAAVALLRRAQQLYPGDFWINHDLGIVLERVTPRKQ